jgi:hypothetical protein
MVGGPVRMANVNRNLIESRNRQFSRLFVACRGKIYTFILVIYSGLMQVYRHASERDLYLSGNCPKIYG